MTCERVRQLLSDYLDGELSSGIETKVQSHLYRCAGCEREHQALRRTVQLLAGHGRQRVPVDCRGAVLARLRAGEEARRGLMPRAEPRAPVPWWRALLPEVALPLPAPGWARASAAAAVLLLCAGSAWFLRPHGGETNHAQIAAVGALREQGRTRPVFRGPTPAEDLRRFHAPDHFGQAMGRDSGIILVSDWVDSP